MFIYSQPHRHIHATVRTNKRVKYYNPIYRIDDKTLEIVIDEKGNPVLEEDFSATVDAFRKWCTLQEKTLVDKFLN